MGGRAGSLVNRVARRLRRSRISLGLRCRGGGRAWSGRLSISPFAKCWRWSCWSVARIGRRSWRSWCCGTSLRCCGGGRVDLDRAGRPRIAGRAESSASTPGVGSVLGHARDIAALAPSVGGAALDLSAQEAGTAAACSAAAGLDPSTGAREPALGLSADRRRAQAARACGLSDHRAQGAERRWRSARTRAGRTIVGARSCASRPPARSLVISSRSRRSRCGGSTCSSSSRRRHADWS
jgi:hypothetical protein